MDKFLFFKIPLIIIGLTAGIFLLLVAPVINLFDFSVNAQQAAQELTGYAWSSNIGWISFNCQNAGLNNCGQSNYSVKVASSTGKLSGYAWSPNIGWISFNEGELSSCPSGSQCFARLDSNTGKLTGWTRAYTAMGRPINDANWTGWIHLTGTSTDNYPYGVSRSGNDLTGYAWGGDVVGWIKFTNVSFGGVISDNLSVVLSANPSSGQAPLTVNLTAVASGTAPGNTTFKFDCENDATIDDTQTLAVNTANSSCVYQNPGTYTAVVITERNGGYTANDSVLITVSQQPGVASLEIVPSNPEIYVGGTQGFSLIYTKDNIQKNVNSELSTTWQSSNLSIATISDGVATAVAVGNTIIEGSYNDGSKTLTASTTLKVVPCDTTPSFTISPLSSTININDTVNFKAEFDQDGNCSTYAKKDVTNLTNWTSDKPSVAAIVETTGVLIGISDGTTTITASYSGYSATASITVQSVSCQANQTCYSCQGCGNDNPQNLLTQWGFSDISWNGEMMINNEINFIITTSTNAVTFTCGDWQVTENGVTTNLGNFPPSYTFGHKGPATISVTCYETSNPAGPKITIIKGFDVGHSGQDWGLKTMLFVLLNLPILLFIRKLIV